MSEFNINGKTLSELSESIRERHKGPMGLKGRANEGELRELCAPASHLRGVAADKQANRDNWIKRLVRYFIRSEKEQ